MKKNFKNLFLPKEIMFPFLVEKSKAKELEEIYGGSC